MEGLNMMSKEQFRNHVRSLKAKFFKEEEAYFHHSRLMTERLLESDIYKKAKNIAIFASKKASWEIQTDEIINQALDDDKSVYIPRCLTETKELEFLEINDLDKDTKMGAFALREPRHDISIPDQKQLLQTLDVIFVPGMAFYAKNGKRLGFGSGYYDRFLAKLNDLNPNAPKVGLGFDFQVFDTPIPFSDHDSQVDSIFSPSKQIHVNGKKINP